jgi:hypothetical protein
MGSVGHGEALDILTQKVNTPYFTILDSDATFLSPNWDKTLISIIDSKIKIIGTQTYPGAKKAPIDFPFMYAALFETKTFKKLNIKFKPPHNEDELIRKSGKDTGYQLKPKYLRAGYSGKILPHTNSIENKESPFYGIGCAEYSLPGNTKIFASHFWKGSTLFASSALYGKKLEQIIFKIPYFNKFISDLMRKRDKDNWIKLCHSIVLEAIS